MLYKDLKHILHLLANSSYCNHLFKVDTIMIHIFRGWNWKTPCIWKVVQPELESGFSGFGDHIPKISVYCPEL
jgi:hypothetical protein